VRTGRQTFSTAHGADFWSYLAGHPRDQADFDQAMAAGSIERARAVLATFTFDGLETIVDVGGGTGRFLAELVAAVPHIRGVLADRAEVVAGAGEVLAETGVADRCEVVPTDFFHSVVPGGDAYVLAQILHDWPDEKCVEILRNCADAMEYGARLWVIEKVVQDDLASTSLEVALLDLNMLICFGARERTGNEYVHLLETTGFTNVAVRETATAWRVIEGLRSD
jgi:orsellinic acid C2-O-methyltransferase